MGVCWFESGSARAQSSGFPVDPPLHARPAPAPDPAPPAPHVNSPAGPPASVQPLPAPPTIAPDAPAASPGAPVVAAAASPLLLPYRDGLPVPSGYHVEKRAATGLIVTGALGLAAGYLAGLAIALDQRFDDGLGWLALPVVGPWPAVAGRRVRCSASTVDEARRCLDSASAEAITIALLAVDGMVQTTGLLLLLGGLASGQPELVRDDLRNVQVTAKRRGDGGFELGLQGHF